MEFYELDLCDGVLDALDDMRFYKTTPIQEHAIPPILEGRDLIGVAQTGTGKTAAYLLPVLSMLSEGNYPQDAVNCIIMAPTRELAQQIDQAMQGFSYYLDGISSVAVYGGNDGVRYEQEKRGFNTGASIIIATPGRLISHISLGNIDLSRVSFFILDEADRMLDMGFSDDIMQIERQLPKDRQTIMFSATMPEKIVELAKSILTDPVRVSIAISRPADGIRPFRPAGAGGAAGVLGIGGAYFPLRLIRIISSARCPDTLRMGHRPRTDVPAGRVDCRVNPPYQAELAYAPYSSVWAARGTLLVYS